MKSVFGQIWTANALIRLWDVQSGQGLLCLLTESLDSTECMKGSKGLDEFFYTNAG